MTKLIGISILSLLVSTAAQAGYLSVGESGEILPAGFYNVGVEPQFVLNEGGGLNADAFIDMPYNDASSFRIQAGAGKVDFHVGGGIKYIPFPDVDNQPAMGLKASLWYARYQSNNILTAQVAPLLSRKVQTDQGLFIPYVAVPFNFNSGTDNNKTGTQFTLGSEWHNPDWPQVILDADLALNMNNSFSTLTLSAAFPLDAEKGFKRR